MKRLVLTIVAMLTIAGTGLAEEQECGTVVTKRDREIMLRQAAAGAYDLGDGPEATVYVPLTFHVVRTSAGTGGRAIVKCR